VNILPPDYKCPTRGWKLYKANPVELELGDEYTLDIPTILEKDNRGKSYSDRCTVECKVTVESRKAPDDLWTLKNGKLTFMPKNPTHKGTF
jgi:hypothetical protein